jgi:hypothetical protein
MNAPPKVHPDGLTIYITGDVWYYAKRQGIVRNIYTWEDQPMAHYFDDVWKYKIKKIVAYSIHPNPDTENLVDILADYQWGFKEKVPPTEKETAFRAEKQRNQQRV